MKKSKQYNPNKMGIIKLIIIVIVTIIFISPFVIMISTSFRTMKDAFSLPVTMLPRIFTMENYPKAVKAIPYFTYMGNTIFITLMCLAGQLLVTPLVAYSLAKIEWKGSNIISSLLLATMMIPYTVTMVPLYKVWNTLGFTNTYIPLIAPAFFGNSFYIIIMRQFFKGLPNSLMEAAKVDGASEFQKYFKIALPLTKPALTTIGIYTFLAAWSDYLAPLIYINKKEKLTLSLGLQSFISEHTIDWTLLMAAAVIFVMPVIILFIVFQKNFVEGISTTGLKS